MVFGAVTAKFPGTFVDADIGIYTNDESSALTVAVDSDDTSFVVGDGTKFVANMYAFLRSVNGLECILVTAVNSNTLTVIRGRDGTTGIAHPVGTAVKAGVPALFFNQVRVELQAIEDALGGSGLDEDLILEAAPALVGDQLKDSPGVVLRAKYWTGASSNYDARVYHDMLTTGPTSRVVWTFGGTERMALSSVGVLSVDVYSVASSINMTNGSILYFMTGAATEQSRITPTAALTTWQGVSNAGIVIQTQGSGSLGIGSENSANYINIAPAIIRIGTVSVQRMTIQSSQFSVEQNMPVKLYTGAQVGQYAQIDSTNGVQVDTLRAITTNGLLTIAKNGSGGIKIGTTNNLGNGANVIIGRSNDSLEIGGTTFQFQVAGTVRYNLGGEAILTNATPLVFQSGNQATEESRFTVAAGSTTWASNGTADILITYGTGGFSVGGKAAVDGKAYLSSPDGTDYREVSNNLLASYTNSVLKTSITDTEIQFNNNVPLVLYNGVQADERGRWSTAALRLESADATGGATTKDSPQLILQGKRWTAGAASADMDFYIQNVITQANTPAIIDAKFVQNGFVGIIHRWRDDNVIDNNFCVPMLPDVDTNKAPAAKYPGGIVRDNTNGVGSKVFTSDGVAWTERL